MANKFKKARSRPVATARSSALAPVIAQDIARPPAAEILLPQPGSRKPVWFASIGLLLIISLVFFRLLGFDFISFDDPYSVYNNPNIKSGFTMEGIRWAFTDYKLFYWQPLTYLSHILDCQLFGLNAGGHHFTNLLIHGANAVLLFLLLLRLTGFLWRSAAVAVLFSIHPLTVESVAWVTERNTLLSALFGILTMWAYVWYVEKPKVSRYILVIAAFILACMSKPAAVVIPGVLLLLDWWPLHRLRRVSSLPGLIRGKTPLFAISAVIGLLTIAGNTGAMATTSELPIQVRISGALVAYAQYLLKVLWPHPLGVFYQYTIPAVEQTTAAALALTLLTLGAVSLAKRFPHLLWGWLWFLLVLLPVSGIFQVGGQSVADRFTYLPLVGIYVALVWTGAECVRRFHIKQAIVIAVAALLVCAMGCKSWLQTETWKDSISLYTQALKATGGNEPMHRNLALEMVSKGRIDEAIQHYREAIRLDPGRTGIHYSLGHLLAGQGLVAEAMTMFSQELNLNPNDIPALKERGLINMRKGRLPEAAADFRRVLKLAPNDRQVNSLKSWLAGVPEQAPAPEQVSAPEPVANASDPNAPVGLIVSQTNPLVELGVQWSIATVLFCVALGFLIPGVGRGTFQAVEKGWSRLAANKTRSLAVVALLPMLIRLAVLPIHPIPQPKIHDEFGYLLIADTFSIGRLTNPTPAMWPHFVTHYIFFQPTYTAKYPIAEPMFMGAAEAFGLPAWVGVWLSVGLMCMALYWMLGGWLPPKWALLGALIAAFRIAISSYWMNSYWGGAVAAMGGALVLGALPRIKRQAQVRDSILFAVGLLLLANTRPYEGFLLSIPVVLILIVWLFREKTIPAAQRFRQVVLPICAVVAVGFAFMLYYNWRVTGDALLMPYKLNQKLYGTPTPFYFQPPLAEPPGLRQYKDLRDNFLWQRNAYMTRWPLSRLAGVTGDKLNTLWEFYFAPALTLPLLCLPLIWRRRRLRPLILSAIFVLIGIGCYPFFFPHYAAPVFAIFLLIIVQGLRYLRLFEWKGRPVGVFVFRSILLLLLCTTAAELLSPAIGQKKTVRSDAMRQLKEAGGKHLVLIRYKPEHSFHFGWLYNDADIDASQVVWARELDAKSNRELMKYYSDRKVWLFEIDEYPPRLSPYPGTEAKQAGL
jgi:protein O-mannosyl-transferase